MKACWIERQQINQKDHPHHKRRKKSEDVKRFDQGLTDYIFDFNTSEFMKNSVTE